MGEEPRRKSWVTGDRKRELLTVGIASGQQPQESGLVDTLRSLFQMASPTELSDVVVLAHLLNPDPKWLSQTLAQVSHLFKPHIEAQRLLVIQGALNDTALSGDMNRTTAPSACEALDSRQKTGYALLMHFASSLSDYFLLIGDQVHCTPKFVSMIYWALQAWEEQPWTTLEFSSLSFSGKVFHASDLSRLASFLLLFQGAPTDRLLSNFAFLLGQRAPIRLSPYLFHSPRDFPSKNMCFKEEEEDGLEESLPENPPAQIYTNMMVTGLHSPEDAYILNESYFQTSFFIPGSTYTVIFDQPHRVTRVQVLTGVGKLRLHRLEHGQVELGYEPSQGKRACTYSTLLGPLVRGQLDQKVSDEDSMEKVRCVHILATAYQQSKLRITQIKIWVQEEET
ncbi:alpha-1,3-mannosyl-glycoprotein 4-beta-N-acetylglucosaminyltransferase-like protein MGAT4E [Tenrec ecaudatus]|uniref:alpha-1,3-mannosyl-glycoprotein 4-beta-N-acetylglucosaminyltransferase-like protein MGAT4E n=1 Tax=Tenrec ecaudatus TaxID=94439 RepID=UPI003F5A3F04